MPDLPADPAVASRPGKVPGTDIRRTALAVELAVLVGAGSLLAAAYGSPAALWGLVGLAGALLLQHYFVAALRRRIGPEPSTLADALTLGRAAVGGVLAGLLVSGVRDRPGPAGWLAFAAVLLAVTACDWLDGPLARRLGATRLGGALDIEADSWVTLWSAAGAVAWGGLAWWALLAPLAHYALPLAALRRGALPRGGDPWWGRVTGVAQMVLLLAALAPVAGDARDAALALGAPPICGAQLLATLALIRRSARGRRAP